MNSITKSSAAIKNNKSYGGKADGLLFLESNGFKVPEFYILDHTLLSAVISKELNFETLISNWIKENQIKQNSSWAVRSSAGIEDGKLQSFAGIFHSEINCKTKDLSAALEKVLRSFSESVVADYHNENNFEVNIILQLMISSEISGIGFSRNPMDDTDLSSVISFLPGLGFKLVSGEESAFMIHLLDKKSEIVSEEEIFYGQIYNEGYLDISIHKEELYQKVKPFLKELQQGLKKLEKLKSFAVDTEFTIYNHSLYWLQVRPITIFEKKNKEYVIWDNSNVASNYPGIVMPLTSSFVRHSYGNAYIAMCSFLGGSKFFISENISLFKNLSGTINGSMYYNVTAWQQLLYQMPFGNKTSKIITNMWGAKKADFPLPKKKPGFFQYVKFSFNLIHSLVFFSSHKRKYIKQFNQAVREFNSLPLETLPNEELNFHFKKMENQLGNSWFAPMLNGFFTLLSFHLLKKILTKSKLDKTHPNFLNDVLFNSGEVISVTIVRELQSLMSDLHKNEKIFDLFKNHEPQIIYEQMLMHFPNEFKRIIFYIEKFGERSEEGELKIETVNYKENPLTFFLFLKKNLQHAPAVPQKRETFHYKTILRENYRYQPHKLFLFILLIDFTTSKVRDRENFRFIRTRTFGIVRTYFRKMDEKLHAQSKIEVLGDTLYLNFDELMDLQKVNEYKAIIQQRKKEYAQYAQMEKAIRYRQEDNEFIPVLQNSPSKSHLKGTGCCSGTLEGKVLIVDEKNIYDSDVTGKILVAKFFEPGWIGLFSKAAGIISERGSLLSHTAILCRELGTPTIVGAKGIMQQLQSGDFIRMNGATGQIEKLSTNEGV